MFSLLVCFIVYLCILHYFIPNLFPMSLKYLSIHPNASCFIFLKTSLLGPRHCFSLDLRLLYIPLPPGGLSFSSSYSFLVLDLYFLECISSCFLVHYFILEEHISRYLLRKRMEGLFLKACVSEKSFFLPLIIYW